jgi:hypothetical protein
MPAATAEEQVGLRAPRAVFCGAASARASIYACTGFLTQKRVLGQSVKLLRTIGDSGGDKIEFGLEPL